MSYHRSAYSKGSREGLPAHAVERLSRGTADTAKPFFTSDLSVNEYVLLHDAGFEPLGLVMGTSMYQIGYQRAGWTQNTEMDVLSQAMYTARELAMTRMEEEADLLGADGIVGVRLDVIRHAWGQSMAEFMVIGTAVRSNRPGDWRSASGRPFTSDLTGQDFWTILRSGHRPVALVMGTCVYHVAHRGIGQWLKQVLQNTEMPDFTQALYDARELAVERMQEEAARVDAEGIVGVNIEERTYGWDAHVIEYFAVGTAIVKGAETGSISAPTFTLSLNDAERATVVRSAPTGAAAATPAAGAVLKG